MLYLDSGINIEEQFQMEYKTLHYDDVKITFSLFYEKENIKECHALFHVLSIYDNYGQQLDKLHEAYEAFIKNEFINKMIPVFKRYFLSDIENQINLLKEKLLHFDKTAVSIVEQPPLDGSKATLWLWLKSDVEIMPVSDEHLFGFKDTYKHYFATELFESEGTSEEQTGNVLDRYENSMKRVGCSVEHNCIRTWLFVSDIDNNYRGVVKGRKDKFTAYNLTEKTHYIASTGIAGRHKNPKTSLLFDAYSIDGLKPEQIQFLHAHRNMSSTSDYGVTFERGVSIRYGHSNHIFISGTASIDEKGKVMHEGDVVKQSDRMIENVSELLKEAGAGLRDVAQLIVYLRDISDYSVISRKMEHDFPDVPKVLVHAPICRPAWLVEIECMAIREVEG